MNKSSIVGLFYALVTLSLSGCSLFSSTTATVPAYYAPQDKALALKPSETMTVEELEVRAQGKHYDHLPKGARQYTKEAYFE